jgi:hypothetical protein
MYGLAKVRIAVCDGSFLNWEAEVETASIEYTRGAMFSARGNEVELSGGVLIGSGERAVVTLIVFAENGRLTRSTLSSDKGRFRFGVPAGGDMRLVAEIQDRSGRTIIPGHQANVGWADVGDRVTIPRLKLKKSAREHFCY